MILGSTQYRRLSSDLAMKYSWRIGCQSLLAFKGGRKDERSEITRAIEGNRWLGIERNIIGR